jgi:SAM-dependent methyltransferase
VLASRGRDLASALWRAHSDAVNARLLERWLPPGSTPRVLKTDLFDEAVGMGLVPLLSSRADQVVGVDVSHSVVEAAARTHPGLDACVADVRGLPFPDDSFDAIVSNSTLDHFDAVEDIRAGVNELSRVLAPGGTLIITLDNRQNPIVALRTLQVLQPLLTRTGLVPFRLGVTCGARGLRRLLRESGLEVREMAAVMHAPPRILGALGARICSSPPAKARYIRLVLAVESLARLPTRFLTAHFVAARAAASARSDER